MNDFLFHVHRGMLEFVGYRGLDPVATCGAAHLTEQDRATALDAVRKSFAQIAAEA
ncbi:hypothetical protein P8605_05730 [Streptomyces sp. T-3]|nr:hypothetical protein [Streptomyces sp. T-3]